MPVTLDALKADSRTLVVDVLDEKLNISYRPSSYTPVTERKFKEAMRADMPANALIISLADLIDEWDLLDEKGQVIPPERKNLEALPSWFIVLVSNAIMDDMNATREDRKNSDGGSRRVGSLASSRSGRRSTN